MDGYTPQSVYPFGNFVLVTLSQIALLFVGGAISWTTRVVLGFTGAGLILFMMPWLACLPLGVNFWVCFIMLIPFGAFSGIC